MPSGVESVRLSVARTFLPRRPYEGGSTDLRTLPRRRSIHHITWSSLIGGIAPTFGRTKPMKASVGSSDEMMKCSGGSGSSDPRAPVPACHAVAPAPPPPPVSPPVPPPVVPPPPAAAPLAGGERERERRRRLAVFASAPSGPAALFFVEKKAVFPFKVNQGDEYERILAAGSEEARDAWVAALRAGLG